MNASALMVMWLQDQARLWLRCAWEGLVIASAAGSRSGQPRATLVAELCRCMQHGLPLLITDVDMSAPPSELCCAIEWCASHGRPEMLSSRHDDGAMAVAAALAKPHESVDSPADFGAGGYFAFDDAQSESPDIDAFTKPVLGVVSLGGAHGDVDVAEGFVLFVTTRQGDHTLPPSLFASARVINFQPTPEGLQDRLLSVVVQHERAALEAKRLDTERELVLLSQRSKKLADSLLVRLSSTQGIVCWRWHNTRLALTRQHVAKHFLRIVVG